jgi:hypothetical protein
VDRELVAAMTANEIRVEFFSLSNGTSTLHHPYTNDSVHDRWSFWVELRAEAGERVTASETG